MQLELFATTESGKLAIPDGEVFYWPDYFAQAQCEQWFHSLRENIQWQQDNIKLFERWSKIPRLHAWYGEPLTVSEYSGIRMIPKPWLPELLEIKQQCEKKLNSEFNCVLVNWYRDGQDCVGWHSDNEPEYGDAPTIASVTLGASRDFDMRHNQSKEKFRITLQQGSLLVMQGRTQRHWQHCVPRRAQLTEQRINLTFRKVINS
jgi:alkylated DNA repair dioxygenase AlkB